jgi:hypothetical protein
MSLAIGILVVYRITRFIHSEHGPWQIMDVVRQNLSWSVSRELVKCFYCLSVWVAAMAMVFGCSLTEAIAFSGGACVLHDVTRYCKSHAEAVGG